MWNFGWGVACVEAKGTDKKTTDPRTRGLVVTECDQPFLSNGNPVAELSTTT